ncbi:hypothetical protein D3C85_1363260 [compost metagenome]
MAADGQQAVGDKAQRLVPAHRLPLAVLLDHRLRDAVGGVVELEAVAAFQTQMATIYRVLRRAHRHHAAIGAGGVHLAADAAVAAGGARPLLRSRYRLVEQRAAGAAVDAGAAADAAIGQHAVAVRGGDAGLFAAPPRRPHELALHLVADAHATLAVDAAIHVDADVGVAVVTEAVAGHVAAGLDVVLAQQRVKGQLGLRRHGAGWVALGQ